MSSPQEPPDPYQPPEGTPPQYGQPAPPPQPPQYGQPPPPPYGQPPQYGQPSQYGQPQYGGYPVAVGTNGLAIASLICAFFCSPLSIVLGFIAKSQIKRTGQGGNGLATAGIVLSIVFIVIGVIVFITAGTASFNTTTGP